MADVVFEGDEFTRVSSRTDVSTVVARSSVADFLLRRRVVKSEREARWLAVAIALMSIAFVLASATWAGRSLGATPDAKPYAQMSAAERAALPVRQRLYLERLEQAERDRQAEEIRERNRSSLSN